MIQKFRNESRPVNITMTLALAFAMLVITANFSAMANDFIPGHVLVTIKPKVNISKLAQDYLSKVLDHLNNSLVYSLETPHGVLDTDFVTALLKDSRVTFAETDRLLTSGVPQQLHGGQYHYAFDGGQDRTGYINQSAYAQIDVQNSHSISTGAGIIVAIIDTGATFNHPDLVNNYLAGTSIIQPGASAAEVADGVFNQGMGHGTMIAGIITRLAPDVKILPIRVMNADGIGSVLDIAKGIDYAVQHGARIINMSFGGTEKSKAITDALNRAETRGIILVASAGNEALEQIQFPAGGNNVLSVASVDESDRKSDFSNFGSFVTVSAPGAGIWSTYYTGGYASWSGTSFAAPFVAAQAALILARYPSLRAGDVRNIVRSTAFSVDNLNPNFRHRLGKGIIDVYASLIK